MSRIEDFRADRRELDKEFRGLRRSPLKKRNAKRRARLFAEDFGDKEYVEHIHSLPCLNCDVYGWTVFAHLKSRGAGGKVEDGGPLCGSRFLGTPAAVEGCHEKWDRHDPELRQHSMRFKAAAKSIRAAFLEQQDTQEDDAA